jgi:hypothetical protein
MRCKLQSAAFLQHNAAHSKGSLQRDIERQGKECGGSHRGGVTHRTLGQQASEAEVGSKMGGRLGEGKFVVGVGWCTLSVSRGCKNYHIYVLNIHITKMDSMEYPSEKLCCGCHQRSARARQYQLVRENFSEPFSAVIVVSFSRANATAA